MPAQPGTFAPASPTVDLDGAATDLPSLAASGPALLFFFQGDCPTSETAAHALPRTAAIPGLTVAAVSQDDPPDAEAFARKHRLGGTVRVLVDPPPFPASDAFGILVTPTWVLLAPGGRIEAVLEGWSRDEANALAARAAALAGARPAVVSTPSDGPAFRPG